MTENMAAIFHPDSKPMKVLANLTDLIVLNLIYLACCVPVVTAGAAQAGLYSALRSRREEGNGHYIAAFFRGFRSGFWRVTPIWFFTALCSAASMYVILAVFIGGEALFDDPTRTFTLTMIAGFFALIYGSVLTLFHSRFDCGFFLLIRNTFVFMVSHPVRSIGAAVLVWGPVLAVIIDPYLLPYFGVPLVFVYFSLAMSLCLRIMDAPFEALAEEAEGGEQT